MSEHEQHLSKKEQREAAREEKERQHKEAEKKVLMKKIGFGLLLVAIVVAIVAFAAMSRKDPSEIVDISPDPSKGPENAPVVIKEYSDFQCPGCQAAAPVVSDLVEEYGDKVRFVYNDFPLPQHTYAPDAGVAAQCVFDQGKFFEYHDILFENQDTWAESANAEEAQNYFRTYAQELGVNMEQFEQCVSDPAAPDRVNEDLEEGRALGVNSTPTFFVNGERITKTPFSVGLREAIDKALNESGQ